MRIRLGSSVQVYIRWVEGSTPCSNAMMGYWQGQLQGRETTIINGSKIYSLADVGEANLLVPLGMLYPPITVSSVTSRGMPYKSYKMYRVSVLDTRLAYTTETKKEKKINEFFYL